jgi:hypothetical protein
MKLTKTRLKQIIREEIQNLRKPLSEGLNMDTSSIKKIENVFQKELNIDDVKLEKKESRARAAYTFRVAGKKHGLYIDVAYDGIWEIYTINEKEFPKHNHWQLSQFSDEDITDEKTALKAAIMMIKKYKKFLLEK